MIGELKSREPTACHSNVPPFLLKNKQTNKPTQTKTRGPNNEHFY